MLDSKSAATYGSWKSSTPIQLVRRSPGIWTYFLQIILCLMSHVVPLSPPKTPSLLHDKFRGTPVGVILPIEYFNAKRTPERLHQVIVVVGDVARI